MEKSIAYTAALTLLVLSAAFRPAGAQHVRTLAIHDEQVLVDGRPIPAHELPPSLDVRGVQASYSFSGDVRPVIELQGVLYTLDGERLIELAPAGRAADDVAVFFRSPLPAAPAMAGSARPDELHRADAATSVFTMKVTDGATLTGVRGVRVNAPEVVFMQQHAQQLEEQADVMVRLRDRLSDHVEVRFVRDLDASAEQLRKQAEEASLMAARMPLLEVRSYLNEVEQHNHDLFERLVEERDMETETVRLAREIHALPEGRQRAERVEQLRRQLREIFELKQENRRREIARLESQLVGLRDRLQERERLRDDIIEHRLQQLLGGQEH